MLLVQLNCLYDDACFVVACTRTFSTSQLRDTIISIIDDVSQYSHGSRRFSEHRSYVQTHVLDLHADEHIHYKSDCAAHMQDSNILQAYSVDKYFTVEAFREFLPCEECMKTFAPNGYASIRQILQLRLFQDSDTFSQYVPEKCIDEDNILLMQHIVKREIHTSRYDLFPESDNISSILHKSFDKSSASSHDMKNVIKNVLQKSFKCEFERDFDLLKVYLARYQDGFSFVGIHNSEKSTFPVEFHCIPILWRNLDSIKPKSHKTAKHKRQTEIYLSQATAAKLFQAHSNLNIIRPSHSRLVGGNYVRKACITLFCWAKGYIPVCEKTFPSKISGFKTDVQEAFCAFGTRELLIGEEITTREDQSKAGTFGRFVEKNGMLYGLSCAHVLFPTKDLLPRIQMQRSVLNCRQEIIGETVVGVFRHGCSNETSVDAALFRIQEECLTDGMFPNVDGQHLRRLGMFS